jgi:hypothetical protein
MNDKPTALEPLNPEPPKPTAVTRYGRPLITEKSLIEEGTQRKLLMSYVQAHMIVGVDYGVIQGTQKKTLLKPGAEKLTDLFMCVPEFEIIERVEDFDRPLFHYVMRCRIITRESGVIVAEGFGSCNSRESRYRWRNGERKCPLCNAPAIAKSKYPPRDKPKNDPPGWYCNAKKSGCGAEYAHDDKQITSQPQGKIENPDAADFANTCLKMAKKRAHVDAAMATARCSDMFTQDMDDDIEEPAEHSQQQPAQPRQQPPKQLAPAQQKVPAGIVEAVAQLTAEPTLLDEVLDLIAQTGTEDQVLSNYDIESLTHLDLNDDDLAALKVWLEKKLAKQQQRQQQAQPQSTNGEVIL